MVAVHYFQQSENIKPFFIRTEMKNIGPSCKPPGYCTHLEGILSGTEDAGA
jgi:hypothetical protein